ncbi:MAG: phospholipid-binding protein MlaC [Alphaproteobacteria bacterium]
MTQLLKALGLATALLTLLAMAPAEATEQGKGQTGDPAAEAFIERLAQKTLTAIADPSLDDAGRQAVFRRLLVANTDLDRFGRSALGRYSRLPTSEQFERYLEVLEDHAVSVLTSRFALFSDHRIRATGSQVKKGRRSRFVIVASALADPSARPVATVHWVLLDDAEGGYRIFDIVLQAAGEQGSFSMLKTQRDEFTQMLRANGRDTELFIETLTNRARPVVAPAKTVPY